MHLPGQRRHKRAQKHILAGRNRNFGKNSTTYGHQDIERRSEDDDDDNDDGARRSNNDDNDYDARRSEDDDDDNDYDARRSKDDDDDNDYDARRSEDDDDDNDYDARRSKDDDDDNDYDARRSEDDDDDSEDDDNDKVKDKSGVLSTLFNNPLKTLAGLGLGLAGAYVMYNPSAYDTLKGVLSKGFSSTTPADGGGTTPDVNASWQSAQTAEILAKSANLTATQTGQAFVVAQQQVVDLEKKLQDGASSGGDQTEEHKKLQEDLRIATEEAQTAKRLAAKSADAAKQAQANAEAEATAAQNAIFEAQLNASIQLKTLVDKEYTAWVNWQGRFDSLNATLTSYYQYYFGGINFKSVNGAITTVWWEPINKIPIISQTWPATLDYGYDIPRFTVKNDKAFTDSVSFCVSDLVDWDQLAVTSLMSTGFFPHSAQNKEDLTWLTENKPDVKQLKIIKDWPNCPQCLSTFSRDFSKIALYEPRKIVELLTKLKENL